MPDYFLHGCEVTEVDDGLRPIRTVKSSIIGFVGTAPDADEAVFPADTPVLITGPRMAASLGAGGTLKDAYTAAYREQAAAVIVIRVEEGLDAAATEANVVGDETLQTGCWALLTAQALTGQTPKLLAAPGHTKPTDPAVKNPVAVALTSIVDQLMAFGYIESPNTNEADAIAYEGLFGSQRLAIVDPHVLVYDTTLADYVSRPGSAVVAGIQSRVDGERGFWWGASNQLAKGIAGTSRPIGYKLSDPNTEANRLTEHGIITFVRDEGFRAWGNRSTSDDPLWAFYAVRRTADMVYESVESAHRWAMDRPFSVQLLLDIRDSVQAYINQLVARGALLGGKVWIDPELNTEADLKAGKLTIDFDIEPPAPLEHLTFRAHREGSYYEELVAEVVATA
ncbi:phage tail sheath C-terminal domain-containing protein [Maritimibacter sp. HL-12]|uniref:phage tail sheath C-terminal domain-containing protein n=1 Tax=Maritimibacter sp. HL-12 TaxID=1162418 RepID=UPI000A0EFEEE|nr:phage tail sheath C-terminal domain-containing protein [Maritimibacter sp. HL-12]SMH35812.1 hypothetical protein SAMN05661107_0646 [Maritimibacter sp. HL-12]